ncbi:hypothetical protein Thiowin_01071 [Thiorhodovibrio winogradskyi]|uniref:Uncharacterized protein n=1 Tax=Thiorhodovibrio winogradskyi TaxID=77007 RepID=A0ABZ0S723_9GAMM|nr:hypothetical protein [Thiorhodovibrio winogradskyi]
MLEFDSVSSQRHQIKELQCCSAENQGASTLGRKAIFDLNCRYLLNNESDQCGGAPDLTATGGVRR